MLIMNIKNLFKRRSKVEHFGNLVENEKEVIPENIACLQFEDAYGKGIIERNPVFTINGIEYYTFAGGLQMICASRYLQYNKMIQGWIDVGMDIEVSKDYINDALEKIDSVYNVLDDPMTARKKLDEASLVLRLYKEHQDNFNVLGSIFDMCGVAFITKSENPYKIDHVATAKKIKLWGDAIAQEGGEDFLVFFWKHISKSDPRWIRRLEESMSYMEKESSQMTKDEISRKNNIENLLILDIINYENLLTQLKHGTTSYNHVKLSRVMSNLAKLKWNKLAYSTIYNIKS